MSVLDILGEPKVALRKLSASNLAEDAKLLKQGILDHKSFYRGYTPYEHPVEVQFTTLVDDNAKIKRGQLATNPALFTDPIEVDGVWRDAAWGMRRRKVTAIRRQHNLRVTMGRDQWQRLVMHGNITANATFATCTGNASATAATTLTNSSASFPTTGGPNTGLQGQVVVAGPNASGTGPVRWATIVSNSGTVLTVDQWYDPTSTTGAAGSTPNATASYVVLPHASPAIWMGISTSTAAAGATDVLRTADGLFGDGSTSAAATEQNANGLVRTFVQPTFPSAANVAFANTFTYTGTGAVTLAKVLLCNTKPVAGSLLFLETLLSAQGTVTSSGDTIAVSWAEVL